MKLYFKMSELIQSDTAIKHKINNMPDINSLDNLLRVIYEILQPIRIAYGKPVIITSGYRCPQVNKLVNGAKNSNHTLGKAVDFKVKDETLQDVWQFCHDNLQFSELILEPSWVHIAIK